VGCGGIWYDTHNVVGGVNKVLPVNYYILGYPPRPEAIVCGVALALGAVPWKVAAQHLSQDFLEGHPKLNPQLTA
jgi:Ni,Fe-hydrogenase III small subunit